MKKIYCLALVALLLLSVGSLAASAENAGELELRVMSFNIRNGNAYDGENHWDLRKELVYDVISDYSADVLGLQEAVRFQLDAFNQNLPEYGEVGIGSEGGTDGQYSAILYLKERFDVDESGTFWISETPSVPSKSWGSAHMRICTWARLVDKDTAHPFYVYNVHLDDGSQSAREKGVQQIMKHQEGFPPLLTPKEIGAVFQDV